MTDARASFAGVRRALLIGCEAPDLPGVAESVTAMATLLREVHGFAAETVVGAAATTAGIRAGFLELARATEAGDAVVVYYAGHGSLMHTAPRGGEVVALIKAVDVKDSELGDFRGLLGVELVRLVQALMARTDNVTVILDCCNAAELVRIDDVGVDRDSSRRYEAELRALAASRVRRSAGTGGVRAVVVAASASGSKSYPDPAGTILLFTKFLMMALAAAPVRATWQEVVAGIRRELCGVRRGQLPGVAGARFRRPFTTEVGAGAGMMIATEGDDGRWRIPAGTLGGVSAGARFELVTYGWGADRRGHRVAEAVAEDLTAESAALRVTRRSAPVPAVVHARALGLRPGVTVGAGVIEALGVPDVFAGFAVGGAEPVGSVTVEAERVVVRDHMGEVVARVGSSARAAERVRAALERVRRWREVWRGLDGGELARLVGCFSATWGVLQGEEVQALAEEACVMVGTTICVKIENPGVVDPLYARAYRVRGDRAIVAWEDSEYGTCVRLQAACWPGDEVWGARRGITLEWPEELAEMAPGTGDGIREWMLLLIADHPIKREVLPSDEPAERPPAVLRGGRRIAAVVLPYRLRAG